MEEIISRRIWALKVIGLALIVISCCTSAAAQKEPGELPEIAKLKAISYQKVTQLSDLTRLPSYHDLEDSISLAEGYSQGLEQLPHYHEPMLTRGNTGVAVFRNASPGCRQSSSLWAT